MSLFLTAFPTAFLINPSKTKTVSLTKLVTKTPALSINQKNLSEVKVLTNLTHSQIITAISRCAEEFHDNMTSYGINSYMFNNGLQIKFENSGQFYNVILSGNLTQNDGLKFAENLFNIFDDVTHKNVRDMGGCEKFYYIYKTNYKSISDLEKELRINNVLNIEKKSENELSTKIDGKDLRFFKNEGEETFNLELEQKISLINIGLSGMTTDVEIKTNIKPDEIEGLLAGTMYYFDKENSSIRLNSGNIPVKFELDNGCYTLKYESKNITAERKEIEDLIVTMNKKAKRDLRLVNDKSYVNYAYKTNYTDKGILINTLLEHGAKNLFEKDGNIYCELYDMQMTYKRISESSSYVLEITHVQDKGNCEVFVKDINEEYGLNIQEATYRKIMERLQKENMILVNEEVNEDNSIVLTIDVGG